MFFKHCNVAVSIAIAAFFMELEATAPKKLNKATNTPSYF